MLVPDLFYRNGAYGPFDAKTAFADDKLRAALMALIGGTSQEMTRRDAAAFLAALSANGVDGRSARSVIAWAAGAPSTRLRPTLTALLLPPASIAATWQAIYPTARARASDIKARVYVGMAGVDRSFPPEQSARLAEALRTAEIDHIIENYVACSMAGRCRTTASMTRQGPNATGSG